MKFGVVVPRYGGEAVGGAEKAMRMIAERLVAWHGWTVDVFTTCSESALTWEDVIDPGTTVVDGVTVHRYASSAGRDPEWGLIAGRVEISPTTVDDTGQQLFIDRQGPLCPDMLEAAASSDAELVAFSPYLFYPAVRGVPMLGDRSILHGAAHDEPALHLDVMQHMYAAAGGLSYYTDAERDLAESLFPVSHKPKITLGLGIDEPDTTGDITTVRETFGIGDRPYVVCVGRVENGKGARALDGFFREYALRRNGDLALVFVGPASEQLDPHPDIIVTDRVDEATKHALVAGALVSISPSAMESFSMVILESWVAGTPVLVNAKCGATVEHASRGQGGLWFDDYPSFEVALDRLVRDTALRDVLALNGLNYTVATFSWEAVIDRYVRFCRSMLAHRK
jgi:glycosyltransferase involved in cell wall biosynthesis